MRFPRSASQSRHYVGGSLQNKAVTLDSAVDLTSSDSYDQIAEVGADKAKRRTLGNDRTNLDVT